MPLKITVNGKKLNQNQLDAVVPIINQSLNLRRGMSKKKFEAACIKSMRKAGCPLT